MLEVIQSETYRKWETGLRDRKTRAFIAAKVDKLRYGIMGDIRPVGQGISELRIHYGPGYRIYFQQRGKEIVMLLCGGDKSSQARDIKRAKELADMRGH
jgi:putative addiction module killer protein